jgi:hypothetical protein
MHSFDWDRVWFCQGAYTLEIWGEYGKEVGGGDYAQFHTVLISVTALLIKFFIC